MGTLGAALGTLGTALGTLGAVTQAQLQALPPWAAPWAECQCQRSASAPGQCPMATAAPWLLLPPRVLPPSGHCPYRHCPLQVLPPSGHCSPGAPPWPSLPPRCHSPGATSPASACTLSGGGKEGSGRGAVPSSCPTAPAAEWVGWGSCGAGGPGAPPPHSRVAWGWHRLPNSVHNKVFWRCPAHRPCPADPGALPQVMGGGMATACPAPMDASSLVPRMPWGSAQEMPPVAPLRCCACRLCPRGCPGAWHLLSSRMPCPGLRQALLHAPARQDVPRLPGPSGCAQGKGQGSLGQGLAHHFLAPSSLGRAAWHHSHCSCPLALPRSRGCPLPAQTPPQELQSDEGFHQPPPPQALPSLTALPCPGTPSPSSASWAEWHRAGHSTWGVVTSQVSGSGGCQGAD